MNRHWQQQTGDYTQAVTISDAYLARFSRLHIVSQKQYLQVVLQL